MSKRRLFFIIVLIFLLISITYCSLITQIFRQLEINQAKEYIPVIKETFPLIYNELEILRTGKFGQSRSSINYFSVDTKTLYTDYPVIEADSILHIFYDETLPVNFTDIIFTNTSLQIYHGHMEGVLLVYDIESDFYLSISYFDSENKTDDGSIIYKEQLSNNYWLLLWKEYTPKTPMP